MEIFVMLLFGLIYAGLGTFIAGLLFPDEDDVWILGIFWPLIIVFVGPIWVIHTCEITGQAIGKFFKQFVRKGDHDERLQ